MSMRMNGVVYLQEFYVRSRAFLSPVSFKVME